MIARLPIRKKSYAFKINIQDDDVLKTYSAWNGVITKRAGTKLRIIAKKIPHSFYVDDSPPYRIHHPAYRRWNTDVKLKLLRWIDILDGTVTKIIKREVVRSKYEKVGRNQRTINR